MTASHSVLAASPCQNDQGAPICEACDQSEFRVEKRTYGPIKQGALSDLFLKVQLEAGLALDTGRVDAKGQKIWKARYGWHDLRHVAASNWLNDGIDLKRLQTWIGHENIPLTIDVYGHLMADAKKDAALAAGAEAALLR